MLSGRQMRRLEHLFVRLQSAEKVKLGRTSLARDVRAQVIKKVRYELRKILGREARSAYRMWRIAHLFQESK